MTIKHQLYQKPDESQLQLVKRAVALANETGGKVVIAKSRDHPPTIIHPGDDPAQVARMIGRARHWAKLTAAVILAVVVVLIWKNFFHS